MAQRGYPLSSAEVGKIMFLLLSTDMSIEGIADRMDCARSTVAKINRTFRIRDYSGWRTSWRTKEPDQRKLA